jgi:hypothetical protein
VSQEGPPGEKGTEGCASGGEGKELNNFVLHGQSPNRPRRGVNIVLPISYSIARDELNLFSYRHFSLYRLVSGLHSQEASWKKDDTKP